MTRLSLSRLVRPAAAPVRRFATAAAGASPHVAHAAGGEESSHLMSRALTMDELDVDLYRSPSDVLWQPPAGRAVYGGQIAACAVRASALSLRDAEASFQLASLHSYFLLPGDHHVPILYRVSRLRDGKSFATRSVVATQHGKAIFSAEMQFHKAEESSLSHQCTAPAVPAPESLPTMQQHYARVMADPRLHPSVAPRIEKYLHAPFPIDVRPCGAVDYFSPAAQEARTQVWLRCTEELGPPSDAAEPAQRAERFLHTAAVTYASDWSLGERGLHWVCRCARCDWCVTLRGGQRRNAQRPIGRGGARRRCPGKRRATIPPRRHRRSRYPRAVQRRRCSYRTASTLAPPASP